MSFFRLSIVAMCAWILTTRFLAAQSLVEAAHSGDRSAVRALLNEGAGLEEQDRLGNTALHWAALNRDAKLVKELLRQGADANAENQDDVTPLFYAVGNVESVKALLESGAEVNHVTRFEGTPILSAAAIPSSHEVLRLLLEHDVNISGRNGEIALRIAAGNGDTESVKMLLDAGVKATNVIRAAWRGNAEIVTMLLDAGADINAADTFTGHALNRSLYSHSPGISRLLIERGADLTLPSPRGQHETPPFLWAAYNEAGDASIAKIMLEMGVDVNTSSALGETALDWARARNNQVLEKLLVEYGGRPGTKMPKVKEIPDHELPKDSAGTNMRIRDSVTRAIDVLQRSSDGYLNSGVVQQMKCVSCHQQTLPAITYGGAMERGIEVDKVSIARQVQDQFRYWTKEDKIPRSYLMAPPQPDAPVVVSYGLLGLSALNYPADELTDAMVRYLASRQAPDGRWRVNDFRPPMQDCSIPATALVVNVLQAYPVPWVEKEMKGILDRATRYLHRAEPHNFNQEAFRLLGLGWAGERKSRLGRYVKDMRKKQQEDGGWAQLDGLPSDAWATGLALLALHTAGGMPVEDEVYQAGVRFLLRTQFDDGSWYVRSRAWPFQPHFESGFPHGKDQWISGAATAWAAMALLLTQPKVGAVEPTDWMAIEVPENYAKKVEVARSLSGSRADAPAVDYHRDIRPIFERSCTGCHGERGICPQGSHQPPPANPTGRSPSGHP